MDIGDQRVCPSREKLRKWLDSSGPLEEHEQQHLRECAECQQFLDSITQELGSTLIPMQTQAGEGYTRRFSDEPEFASMQERLASLEPGGDVMSTMISSGSGNTGSTHQQHAPPKNECSTELLAALQRQLPDSKYKLRKVLGRGAGGVVILAHDSTERQDVAIKFLASSHVDADRRFCREAEVLQHLSHPNIVSLLGFGTCNESPQIQSGGSPRRFMVMEYCAGGTAIKFQRQVKRNSRLIAKLLVGAAEGLQFAHEKGLVHRDIKPSNLLYDLDSDTLKVADFGLSTAISQDQTALTRSGDILGTPEYMSPEHVVTSDRDYWSEVDHRLTARSDIYSFGATMYALLTGQPPARGSLAAILRQIVDHDPPRPTVYSPGLPLALEAICLKCLEKKPSQRYQSMQAVANDLNNYLAGESTIAKIPTKYRQVRRWAGRNPALAASGALIVLLLCLITIGSVIAASGFWNQHQRLKRQQQENLVALAQKAVFADPRALPMTIDQIQESAQAVLPSLRESWSQSSDPRAQINAAIALTALGESHHDYIVDRVAAGTSESGHCQAIYEALNRDAAQSLEAILGAARQADVASLEQCKLAILALRLGDNRLFLERIQAGPDAHSELIHNLTDWFGDVEHWIDLVSKESDHDILFTLWSGLGLVDPASFGPALFDRLEQLAVEMSSQDSGVTSAVNWTLKRVEAGLRAPSDAVVQAPEVGPYSQLETPEKLAGDFDAGFRMIRVPAGQFQMGNGSTEVLYADRVIHPVTITRDFWLADREVSIKLFQAYLSSLQDPNWQADAVISPTEFHPVQQVSWYQAIGFCNWLSDLHGYERGYRLDDNPIEFLNDENEVQNGDAWSGANWILNLQSNGYRLPTEAEFEYACRAATQSMFSFGDDMIYFDRYAAWSNNTRVACSPVGALMPNRWGFHDMHGNVWEWVDDWYQPLTSSSSATDPHHASPSELGKVFRGGGICTYTGYPDSSSRGYARPDSAFNNVGFRVARSAE